MEICEFCQVSFDPDDAEEVFEDEHPSLYYGNIHRCLCGQCAIDAITDEVEGVYYETCEECGREFDLISEEAAFRDHYSGDTGISLSDNMTGKILCLSCCMDLVESELTEETEDEHEGMSVAEAAEIWVSHGRDEDYLFGYSEDELEEAL